MSGATVLQGHGVNFVKLSRRRRHQKLVLLDACSLAPALKSSRERFGSCKPGGLAAALDTRKNLRAIYARIPASTLIDASVL